MTDRGALVGGRLLARNTILNLLGHGLPLLVALVAIPPLIAGLGDARFGVLTIVWMVIGYFSLFDLGLGRALTQLVAERLGSGWEEEIPSLAWTALAAMFALGIAGAGLLALAAPWLVDAVLHVPPAMRDEAVGAMLLLALSLPFVVSTAGLRGVLEAYQRFGVVNALRVPMGIATFAAPLLVLPFSRSLVPVTGVLVLARIVLWAAHLVACLAALPALRRFRVEPAHLRPLLHFGGWMTVSNVVSPVMVHFDRLLIAAVLSVAAVTYYVTPYEVVIKLLIVPTALLGVFFPAFAAAYAADRPRVAVLFDRALRLLLLALFPACLLLVVGAEDGLRLWLGEVFAERSARVLQWLAIGVFLNAAGHLPFALVQGAGRPDLTGKLHLLELPLYAAAIWLLTRAYGIEGAAIAWTARVALDTAVLMGIVWRIVPEARARLARVAPAAAALTLALAAGMMPDSGSGRLAVLAVGAAVLGVAGWTRLLGREGRGAVGRAVRPRAAPPVAARR